MSKATFQMLKSHSLFLNVKHTKLLQAGANNAATFISVNLILAIFQWG